MAARGLVSEGLLWAAGRAAGCVFACDALTHVAAAASGLRISDPGQTVLKEKKKRASKAQPLLRAVLAGKRRWDR